MKKEYNLSIIYDTDKEEIESYSETLDREEDEIYFDTGEELIKMPSAILKYIEGNILGLA